MKECKNMHSITKNGSQISTSTNAMVLVPQVAHLHAGSQRVDKEILSKPFDAAAMEISQAFFERVRMTEKQYCDYFDLSLEERDSVALTKEQDIRDWGYMMGAKNE